MRMKLHEKIWMYLLNVCVVMLAICCIVLAHEIDILKDRVSDLEATKPIKTLSMVMDFPDASELKAHEPPGRTYFDVPLEEELQDYIFDICEEYGVDPELIVSMIFHESNFDSAVIGENDSGYSYGLMQIMPETGKWLAGKFGEGESYTDDALFDVDTNLKYGCWYLRFLKEKFSGDLRTVTAAYHAGQGQVQGWVNSALYSDDGLTVERIPFDSTATYVERVETAYEHYRDMYSWEETP